MPSRRFSKYEPFPKFGKEKGVFEADLVIIVPVNHQGENSAVEDFVSVFEYVL